MNAETVSKIFVSACCAGIFGGLAWLSAEFPLPLAIAAYSFLALTAFVSAVRIWV